MTRAPKLATQGGCSFSTLPCSIPTNLGSSVPSTTTTANCYFVHKDGRRYDIGARVTVPDLHEAIQASRYVYIIQTKNHKPVTGSEMILHIMF